MKKKLKFKFKKQSKIKWQELKIKNGKRNKKIKIRSVKMGNKC